MKRYIDLLGRTAVDKITGFRGIITSLSFDLYGCIQAVITPGLKDGDIQTGHWFDVSRLKVSNTRIMKPSDFDSGYIADGGKGPAEKPLP